MNRYTYTTQRELTAAFWEDHPRLKALKVKTVKDFTGNGRMYVTDIRCAFSDYTEHLNRSGMISDALAYRATLEPPKTRKRR